MPSAVQPEEDDAHMEDSDSATTSSADEGDCLGNPPASSETRPAQDEMLAAEDEVSSTLPPQGVDPKVTAPHRTPLSPQSNEDRGPRPVQESSVQKATAITCSCIQATAW